MALPTNIVATPNTSPANELPRTISVSGANIFERPYSTKNEKFSQVSPDVLAADWSGATQGVGIIGDSFVGNGVDSYIDLSSKLPDAVTTGLWQANQLTGFLGFSFWFKTSSTTRGVPFSLRCTDIPSRSHYPEVMANGKLYFAFQGFPNGANIGIDGQYGYIDTILNDGEWHHCFAYLDNGDGVTSDFGLYVDGSNANFISIDNDHITLSRVDTFDVGTLQNAAGTKSNFFDGEVSNLHISVDPLFKNELAKYYNQPTIKIGTTDITPSNYASETEVVATVPSQVAGTYSIDVTNSSGLGGGTFSVISSDISITATPNTSLASELPRTVTINGTNIFERPYSTANEQFTQVAPDVLAANWIGGATQVDGVIGKAFDGNNSDSYVNISSKIPDYKATNFIGVSFWATLDSVDNDCLISLQKDSDTSNRPLEIHVNTAYNMYLSSSNSSAGVGTKRLGNSMPATGVPLHIFAWVQVVGNIHTMGFYINGVAETVLNGGGQSGFATETADGFRVGGRIYNGNLIQPSDAKISNLHISNNPLFKNELAKYKNLPTVEVN